MILSPEEIEKRVADSYELPNKVLEQVADPIVSVRTSTYNHAPYIKQCIEGVLMQKTTFPFEFIIGEDFSTDGTRDIVFEYAKRYPNIIRVVSADYNVGSKANGQRCIQRCRGKYIAICEGDDYWIDPLKLQRQVEFLETHSDYSMCFHNAFIYYVQQHNTKLFNHFTDDCDLSMHDAIHFWHVPTASILIRKEEVYYPNWLVRIYCGDYPLIIYACHKGKIRCFHNIMSVYRVNTIGTSATSQVLKRIIFTSEQKILLLKSFDKGTNQKYHNDIESKIEELQDEIKFQKIKCSKNNLD